MDTACLFIVMAAGEGTRMNSDLPKVLHPVLGVPMIDHVLSVCPQGARPIVVVGHGRDAVMAHVGDGAEFVVQQEQNGTGHAVMMARDAMKDHRGYTLVLAT